MSPESGTATRWPRRDGGGMEEGWRRDGGGMEEGGGVGVDCSLLGFP